MKPKLRAQRGGAGEARVDLKELRLALVEAKLEVARAIGVQRARGRQHIRLNALVAHRHHPVGVPRAQPTLQHGDAGGLAAAHHHRAGELALVRAEVLLHHDLIGPRQRALQVRVVAHHLEADGATADARLDDQRKWQRAGAPLGAQEGARERQAGTFEEARGLALVIGDAHRLGRRDDHVRAALRLDALGGRRADREASTSVPGR